LLGGPVIGIFPAIAISSKVPKSEKFLQYPNLDYWENNEYRNEYITKAHRIKQRKVWGMYAAGSAIWTGLLVYFINLRPIE